MGYKLDLDTQDYDKLVASNQLTQKAYTGLAGVITAEYKHLATDVTIKIQVSLESITYLYAETNSSESMEDFKDHLSILRIE